jgi:hypothetical protein
LKWKAIIEWKLKLGQWQKSGDVFRFGESSRKKCNSFQLTNSRPHQIQSIHNREQAIPAYLFTRLGQLDTQATGSGSLSNTSLSSDKDPLQTRLIDNVLQRRLGKISVVNLNIRHVSGCLSSLLFNQSILAQIMLKVMKSKSKRERER